MGRAQFEYDEVGNTFYYVVVSFYAVILFPLTHFLWPSARKFFLFPEDYFIPLFSAKKVVTQRGGCQCEGDLAKRARTDAIKPWETRKRILKAFVLLILWAVFLLLAYKVSQIEHTFEEYDPYKILGLDQVCFKVVKL
jgi:translocation protein SEC63